MDQAGKLGGYEVKFSTEYIQRMVENFMEVSKNFLKNIKVEKSIFGLAITYDEHSGFDFEKITVCSEVDKCRSQDNEVFFTENSNETILEDGTEKLLKSLKNECTYKHFDQYWVPYKFAKALTKKGFKVFFVFDDDSNSSWKLNMLEVYF